MIQKPHGKRQFVLFQSEKDWENCTAGHPDSLHYLSELFNETNLLHSTGNYVMLVKVKWVIKVGAHCYVAVWRCQQVIIWQLSSKNLDLGQLFQILCLCTLLVVRSVVQFNCSCIKLDWTMDQAVGPCVLNWHLQLSVNRFFPSIL